MPKTLITLGLVFSLSAALGVSSLSAKEIWVTDNLGFKTKVDVPDAQAAELAPKSILAIEEAGTEEWPFQQNAFDLSIGISTVGVNDTTAANELVILDASISYFFSRAIKAGFSLGWDQMNRQQITVGIQGQVYLTRDPLAGHLWFFRLAPLSATFLLNEDAAIPGRSTAFNFAPAGSFGIEWPTGSTSWSFLVGAGMVVYDQGVKKEDGFLGGRIELTFRDR
jgi:hypothetical protein